MSQAAELLALRHVQALSRDIEEQLTAKKTVEGYRPLAAVLARAKASAALALAQLIDIEPTNAEGVRTMQNEVRRFSDMVKFVADIVSEGIQAEYVLDEADRQDIEGLIVPSNNDPERQAELNRLGIHPTED